MRLTFPEGRDVRRGEDEKIFVLPARRDQFKMRE
jgi:hypothetical protein